MERRANIMGCNESKTKKDVPPKAAASSALAAVVTTKAQPWIDPQERIWGFHVHQELPEAELGNMLNLQEECKKYLAQRGAIANKEDVIMGGYGPHLNPMWELRLENLPRDSVLGHLGAAISWMCVNRAPMASAYVHATMHDAKLPDILQLKDEGDTNQANQVWFGKKVDLLEDFFFNPPLTPKGNHIVDTRTSRVLTAEQKETFRKSGRPVQPKAPESVLIRGFHIHCDYESSEEARAMRVMDGLVMYMIHSGIRPSSTRLYEPRENGPHIMGGWEVKLEYRGGTTTIEKFGRAVGWLMCNREGLDFFMHGVSWEEGDHEEELLAHKEYFCFMGNLQPLDLTFFEKRIQTAKEK